MFEHFSCPKFRLTTLETKVRIMYGVSLLSVLSYLVPKGLNKESTSYSNAVFHSMKNNQRGEK